MATLLVKNASALYSAMALKGYTLKSLSDKVGVTTPYLSTVLRGRRNPSPILAKKIARCLGVEISDVFITQESHKS